MSNSEDEKQLLVTTSGTLKETLKDVIKDRTDNNSDPSESVKTTKHKKNSNMTKSDSFDRGALVPNDPKMSRRLMQISEENTILKKQLKKQEERIKILATKLIRVISERSNKTKREDILLDEQRARISDLEHEVSSLREKLHVTKQQLSSYTKLIPPHHPPSRQVSMLSSSTATSYSKLNTKPRSARSSTSQPPRPSTVASSSGTLLDKEFADRVEQLLLEAKAENQALEDQLKHCRQRLNTTEGELEKIKETLNNKESEHQEEILTIKSELDKEQDVVNKKKQLSDNIQLIRLQRESRRTASWLSTLEAQCRALESSLTSATETVQQLETQLAEAQEELGTEQEKNINVQKQMEDATSSISRLKELEAQIAELQEECKILKETNESLLNKAFSVSEKAEKAESIEMNMRIQMSHLESVLKSEMRSKTELQNYLRQEKERSVILEMTNEKLQETLEKLNTEMEKFKISDKNVKDSEENQLPSWNTVKGDECIDGCVHGKQVTELFEELQTVKQHLLETKAENASTKSLLLDQVSANKDYQREVEDLTAKLNKADEFHHKKLQDFVKVLEERTKQISFLEKCMDDWKQKQGKFCDACNCPQYQTVQSDFASESVDIDTSEPAFQSDGLPLEKSDTELV